jgi:hypothetical protein
MSIKLPALKILWMRSSSESFKVIHVSALIKNSYNKANKCTNVKIIFLHTVTHKCDMFQSISKHVTTWRNIQLLQTLPSDRLQYWLDYQSITWHTRAVNRCKNIRKYSIWILWTSSTLLKREFYNFYGRKETNMHGHDRHNTTILSIIHNMSTTCFGQ